jgi:hypothetical protein
VSRDLANAVEDDWKRGAVDAAKHRAVKQLEGYDAFKNMVKSWKPSTLDLKP